VELLIQQLLNGVSYGGILFLVAAGFSLTFGVLRVLNLAHGALFAVGAFLGWTIFVGQKVEYSLAVLAGGFAAAVLGLVIERLFLSRMRDRLNDQVLVTLGFALIMGNALQWIWGGVTRAPYVPSYFSGTVGLAGITYPTFRLAIIAIAIVVGFVMWFIDRNTRIGARVRAGRDDQEMLEALGVDFDRLALAVFIVGAFLAGAAGVLGGQLLGANLVLPPTILLVAIVVVVVGGLGSVGGSFFAAMIIGTVDAVGRVLFPEFAMVTIYLAMIAILLVRPLGLGGREFVRT
jgi:branched-subunit amino acid ABC-type transport system permease component